MRNSSSARRGKREYVRAPNHHRGCSQCQRFEHVGATSDTAVQDDRGATAHPLRNSRQSVDRSWKGVEIASPVIGNNNAIRTDAHGLKQVARIAPPPSAGQAVRSLVIGNDIYLLSQRALQSNRLDDNRMVDRLKF